MKYHYLLPSLLLGLAACDSSVPDPVVYDDLPRSYVGASGFHISDFQNQANFWTDADINSQATSKAAASGEANALVPLIFDQSGYLYTPKGFNNLVDSLIAVEEATGTEPTAPLTYYTEATTFKAVTGYKDLNQVGAFGVISSIGDSKTEGFHVYDPYVRTDIPDPAPDGSPTRGSTSESLGGGPSPPSLWVADAVIGRQAGIFGHAAIVTTLNNGQNTGGNPNHQNTRTMEAIGYRSNNADEVQHRPFSVYWLSSDLRSMWLRYRSSTTWTKRINAAAYARVQDPDTYRWWTPKWTSSKWYCSKLVWKAYKTKVGVDIDSNWGYWVIPGDMNYDSSLTTTYYWQRP